MNTWWPLVAFPWFPVVVAALIVSEIDRQFRKFRR